MLTKEQGKKLIELARKTISSKLDDKEVAVEESLKKEFCEKLGVFVTLTIPGELRGCIGTPEPIYELWEGVANAAESAAFGDPRFAPLDKKEFENVDIEISVLTKPKIVEARKAEDYLLKIDIGKDGLIIEGVYGKGLLLPQVAVEWRWDVKEFLENLCQKAGMSSDSWKDLSNKIYKFQAQIFNEKG